MRLRGGELKKNIEIEAGEFEYVEIHCREQTGIYIKANEIAGDDFNVALFPSAYVKKTPLVGVVTDFDPDPKNALWSKEKVSSVDEVVVVEMRDVVYLIFDNYHARSKYKSIDVHIQVAFPPLKVGIEPLSESFEVDAGYVETIDVDANKDDVIRIFGRVTKGNDITVHILAKIYETPDSIHTDKAYFTKEKVSEIDVMYQSPRKEPLLVVFDNEYSLRTTKTIDVSIQVIREAQAVPAGKGVCPFCQAKIDAGISFCPHCGGKL